jgi:serine/threonine protein kinase
MAGASYSILIVDDHTDVIQSLTSFLEQLAHQFEDSIEIHQATSVSDIMPHLSRHNIDVIFLDYQFESGMTGEDFIRKSNDLLNDKLVILMSGVDEEVLKEVLVKAHKQLGKQFAFLRKPFEYIEIQDKYLEIGKFFLSRPYPYPLAYAHQVFASSSTAQGQITAMKDLFEAITKFSVFMFMADLLLSDILDEAVIGFRKKETITLGDWLSLLGNFLTAIRSKEDFVFAHELVSLFRESGHLGLIHKFEDEVQDTEIGHGYVKEEGWYASLVREYAGSLESLFEAYSFASRYKLLTVEQIDFADNNMVDYKVRVLMGAESKFNLISLKSKQRLRRNEIYIMNPRGEFLSLHPLLLYRVCKKCSKNELYMLEGIGENSLIFNAPCNHRFASKELKSDFDLLYEKFVVDVPSAELGFKIGQRIADTYEIEEIIDYTNHSIAIKAWYLELRSAVVIKLLRLNQFPKDQAHLLQDRLLEEGRILFGLGKHDHIGQVFGTVHVPSFGIGIVMEWISGDPLQRVMYTDTQMDPTRTIKIGIDLSKALAHIHSQGIVHYDIKPNNIILTSPPNEKAILIDFDVAQAVSRHPLVNLNSNLLLQKRATKYSAPEQFTNLRQVGTYTDIFSVGMVLYELLTQQLPYQYHNDPSLYDGQLPKPPQHNIPNKLYSLLCLLLSQEPDKRPSAAELQKELQACLEQLGEDNEQPSKP